LALAYRRPLPRLVQLALLRDVALAAPTPERDTAQTMSQENVEFVTGLYAAGEGMDKEQLLAGLPQLIEQICDPEIEWIEDPGRADSQTYHGHAGVLRSWQHWLEGFDEYAFTLERVVDCGDAVFVAAMEEGRGATSGATVSASLYQVVTMRDGKILRFQEFYDENAALEAAGLSK
jgi:ketosteroid isomerase-like protein